MVLKPSEQTKMTDSLIVFLASKLHVVIVVLAVIAFLLSAKKQRMTMAITAAISLPLAYLIGKLASFLHYTERPFSELGIAPLVPHIADNGFPSEHTLYAMVIAAVVLSVHRKFGLVLPISSDAASPNGVNLK